MTKCNILEEIFKVCVIKSYKVAFLKYEPVLHVLTEIFESHSCFFQTQQWKNVLVLNEYSKFVRLNPIKWLFYSMNQFYMCWQRSLRVTAVSSKHNTDKMWYSWRDIQSDLNFWGNFLETVFAGMCKFFTMATKKRLKTFLAEAINHKNWVDFGIKLL